MLWIAYKMYLCDIIHNTIQRQQTNIVLWIAYKMYLCDIIHNNMGQYQRNVGVVNCLQNVSLRYYSQFIYRYSTNILSCELLTKCIFAILFTIESWNPCAYNGCELLTKCIFAILFTMKTLFRINLTKLWIAYKMYLCDIIHNRPFHKSLCINRLRQRLESQK